jgi:hypothetical protein
MALSDNWSYFKRRKECKKNGGACKLPSLKKNSKEEIAKALTGNRRDEYVFELKQSYEILVICNLTAPKL